MGHLRVQCRVSIAVAMALWCASAAAADTSTLASAQPSALLTVDQNRTTVIERIVGQWGAPLERSGAGLSSAQLRIMLQGLRADHLLTASLAGSLPGLRDVLANSLTSTAAAKGARLHPMALGDTTQDLVYTPVNPCRLFDSRPAQGGLGALTPNVRRTYGATSPVTNQGGPGSCNAPTGAAVALIQIGTLTPAGNGYLQGGPQGIATFPNALLLYQAGDQYGTSVAMPLNVTNGRFDVQAQFAATDLYGDLLGYFRRPKNYGGVTTITGNFATVGGGADNTATGEFSTVAGGQVNEALESSSTVGGGASNSASGFRSTVGGGGGNTASGTSSTVGAGDFNTASGTLSIVAGGDTNTASGQHSTVGGGLINTASGSFSTVAGGQRNIASGTGSFAAGSFANANVNGCFAFGDNSTTNVVSCGITPNQFVARAIGGVYFLTAGNSDATYTGAKLAPGATAWTVYSDSIGKDNLRPVDAKAVLRKVAALPLATWNWRSQDASIRHMGPMAQDFHAAFGLGETPTGISTVDADGVALAAIQGLNAKVDSAIKEKNRQLAQQASTILEHEREIADLKQQLQSTKSAIADIAALKAALAELPRKSATVAVK
jgi:hypothetical protein